MPDLCPICGAYWPCEHYQPTEVDAAIEAIESERLIAQTWAAHNQAVAAATEQISDFIAELIDDDGEPFEPSWYYDAPARIAPDHALIRLTAAELTGWAERLVRSPPRRG